LPKVVAFSFEVGLLDTREQGCPRSRWPWNGTITQEWSRCTMKRPWIACPRLQPRD